MKKELQEIVKKTYEYTISISITEEELLESINKEDVYKDILYDLVFNNASDIKAQIENDKESYLKNSIEYKDITKFEKLIIKKEKEEKKK